MRKLTPIAVTVAALLSPHAVGDSPAVKAARARQDAVKTLEVEFEQTEVLHRGVISTEMGRKDRTWPDREVTLRSVNRLALDGKRFRYEDRHPRWIIALKKGVPRRLISIWDGTIGSMSFPDGIGPHMNGRVGEPTAYLQKEVPGEIHAAAVEPLILAFRGAASLSRFSVAELKPSCGRREVHGSLCDEYGGTLSGLYWRWNCRGWLDPARDHHVVRIWSRLQQQPVRETEIDYRPHDRFGWVPRTWTRTVTVEAGAILRVLKVQVLSLRLNEPIPAGQFDHRFPVGMVVLDRRNQTRYRATADGGLSPIVPAAARRPTPSEPSLSNGKREVLLPLAVLLVALLLGWGLWKWRQRGS
jgi:hypothetical protein